MFRVVPQPEFSAWYRALPGPLAEEVTAAVDLLAAAGGAFAPDQLSPVLLWYDDLAGGSSKGLTVPGTTFQLELAQRHTSRYLLWRAEVLGRLGTHAFRERLESLPPKPAAEASALIEQLKHQLSASKVASNLMAVGLKSTASASKTGEALREVDHELKHRYLELLGIMSFGTMALGAESGVRELCIASVQPPLRVLVGLDLENDRLLLLLGEALDRKYYGDSVERAQAAWRRYAEAASEEGAARP